MRLDIARRLAARFPGRVLTLTLVGSPPPRRDHPDGTVAAYGDAPVLGSVADFTSVLVG